MSSPFTVIASSVEQTYLDIDTLHLSPPANTTEHEKEQDFEHSLFVNHPHPSSPFASTQGTLENRASLEFSFSDHSQEGSCFSPADSSQKEHSLSPVDSSQQSRFTGTVDAAKSYILSKLHRGEDIKIHTPKEVFFNKEIQALLNPKEEVDRALIRRYYYDLDSNELTIVSMESPLHGSIITCLEQSLRNACGARNKALKPLRLWAAREAIRDSPRPEGSRKTSGYHKRPDALVAWRSSSQLIWSVVFEVGFSESYDDLVYDAHQWLSSALLQVNTVVIIKIDEKQTRRKSDAFTERLRSLVTRFGDDRARARYGIEIEDDVVDLDTAVNGIGQELHLEDWVGDFRAYAEKWKREDGKPQRCGTRLEVYPRRSTQEDISIPFTDIIPPKEYAQVKDSGDIPQDFLVDMDDYRDEIELGIKDLAMDRACKNIRPEGLDDDDPEYLPKLVPV